MQKEKLLNPTLYNLVRVLKEKNVKTYYFEPSLDNYVKNDFERLGVSVTPAASVNGTTFQNKARDLLRELRESGFKCEVMAPQEGVYLTLKVGYQSNAVNVYYREKLPEISGFKEIQSKTFLNHLNV